MIAAEEIDDPSPGSDNLNYGCESIKGVLTVSDADFRWLSKHIECKEPPRLILGSYPST